MYGGDEPTGITDSSGQDIFGDIAKGISGGLNAVGIIRGVGDLINGNFSGAFGQLVGVAAGYVVEGGCNVLAAAATAGTSELSGVGELGCAVLGASLGEAAGRAAESAVSGG
jgi:hypothetical protein